MTHRGLHGQTIVVTRMRDQAAGLSTPLRAAGAEVIEAPTLELTGLDDYDRVDETLRAIRIGSPYTWLVVTSANGVDAMFNRLAAIGGDRRSLAGVRIAAIGSATAARLRDRGIEPDLIPAEAVGESMAEALIGRGIAGRRILLLRADGARPQLPAALGRAGAACDDLPIYRTARPPNLPASFLARLDAGKVDWITLTSPSSFVNLLSLLGKERAQALRKVKLASIGPVTTRAIRQAGYNEAVEADPHDAAGLVAAIRAAAETR